MDELPSSQADENLVDFDQQLETLEWNTEGNPLQNLQNIFRASTVDAVNGEAGVNLQKMRGKARVLLQQTLTVFKRKSIQWEPALKWIEKYDRQGYIDFFEGLLGLSPQKWRNGAWLCHDSQKPETEGGFGLAISGIVRFIENRFLEEGGWKEFIAFMDGKELKRNPLYDKVKTCVQPRDFRQWFEEIGINFMSDCWRDQEWWKKNGKSYEWQGVDLRLMIQAIRNDDRFLRWENFLAFMDRRGGNRTYLSYAKAVAECKNLLDFIVYFADLGIPGNMWENSEWLTDRSQLPPKDGIGKNLSGLPGGIRGDGRWGASYPQFVAWMHEKEEPDPSMAEKVRNFKSPKDARDLLTNMDVPENIWTNSEELAKLAKARSKGRNVNCNGLGIHGFIIAIRKRFGGFPEYASWYESKDFQETWKTKILKCKNREDFIAEFNKKNLQEKQWRNSSWLMKNHKSLLNSLCERFDGKFRGFIAFMDGVPEEGITSDEIAITILKSEEKRLSCKLDNLLISERIIRMWRTTPAIVTVLEYFANDIDLETIKTEAIEAQKLSQAFETELDNSPSTNPRRLAPEEAQFLHVLRLKFIEIIGDGIISDKEQMDLVCKELSDAQNIICTKFKVPNRIVRSAQRSRNRARLIVENEAGWKKLLRLQHKITPLGLQVVNIARIKLGLPEENRILKEEVNEELFIDVDGVKPSTLEDLKLKMGLCIQKYDLSAWNALLRTVSLLHEMPESELDKQEELDKLKILQAWTRQLIVLDNSDWPQRFSICCNMLDAYHRFLLLLDIDFSQEANLQSREVFSKGGIKIHYSSINNTLHKKHGSTAKFMARMQERIPMQEFISIDEVFLYADREILRLKKNMQFPGGEQEFDGVTEQDYDVFFRSTNVEKNIVLREIDLFLQQQEIG